MTKSLYLLGKMLSRHRWITILVWVFILAGMLVWARGTDSTLQNNLNTPGTDAQKAQDILSADFVQAAGSSATIVFQADNGSVTDPPKQKYVSDVLEAVNGLDNVVGVSNPYQQSNGKMVGVSGDKSTAMSTVNLKAGLEISPDVTDELTATVNSYRQEGEAVGANAIAGGNAYFITANTDTNDTNSEILGLSVAIIILLVAFGSVVAMGLPLVNAIFGLGVSISGLLVLANFTQVSSIGPTIASMLGLGVGIDYALFIVNRFRENLHAGHNRDEAIGRSIGTAGQAVVVAGLTVIIALMGLLLIDIPILSSIAYSAAIAVAIAILVSLTLLPALMSATSSLIEKFNLHHAFKRTGFKHDVSKAWGQVVTKKPLLIGGIALVTIAMFIIPILRIQLGPPGEDTIPTDNPQRIVYNIIAEEFGAGFNGPLLIVEQIPPNTSEQQVQANLQNITQKLSATPNIVAVAPPTFNQDKTVAIQAIIPGSAPASIDTVNLVNTLDDSVLPGATEGTGITTTVGGFTATFADMSEKIANKMPIFIGSVVLVAFLLLVLVFRSLFVPFVAALMIGLSACATFGVMVAVFQWGWFGEFIGLDATGPLVSYVPIMVFAILFGLTMDYEIFLVSRIREAYLKNPNNRQAIVTGIQNSARIIIVAALIMFSVFASFNLQQNVVVKMFGTGLAVAIVVDVFLVRMMLVPAILALGGKITWWFPSWLSWLPDMHFEDDSVLDKK